MSPLVTIVVISYNHSRYIKENLDSIQAQTYPNIELIVADDASSDNSVEVYEQWLQENKYPALKNYHQKNTGLATTLNECIQLAKGKYIKMIAADDYLHPEAIADCIAKMEMVGDEYGMVFTDTYCIDESSKIIKDFANYNELGNIDPLEFRKKLIEGNRIAALTVMMRLDVVIETGDYDAYYLAEDYYRWLMINKKYLIAYVPKKLAYYRIHENNISKLKAEKIDNEDLLLKMMFDDHGIAKNKINDTMYYKYMNAVEIDNQMAHAYKNYKHHTKRLQLAIAYNIPRSVYRFISKYI